MSPFEWAMLALVFVGMVIPIWVVFGMGFVASRRNRGPDSAARYFAYARAMDFLIGELKSGETRRAPILVATIRELGNFTEYRDVSLLFLEEITVTGEKKFDRVLENELKAVEAKLLAAESGKG